VTKYRSQVQKHNDNLPPTFKNKDTFNATIQSQYIICHRAQKQH